MALSEEGDIKVSPEILFDETAKNRVMRRIATAASKRFATKMLTSENEVGTESDFSGVCLDPSNAPLPSFEWNHCTLCDFNRHSFHFIQAEFSSSGNPLSVKTLNVQQVKNATFALSTFALGQRVDAWFVPKSCKLRFPDDSSFVSEAPKSFAECNICPGGPPQQKYTNVYL